jgi:ABC-type Fe3+-siderophore transport system permease subunit
MMQTIKDLFQAAVMAALIGGPFFYYILFQMKP